MKKVLALTIVLLITTKTFGQVTFKDVVSIFYNRCTSCHNQVTHATSLLYYSNVAPLTSEIQAYLTSGYMPAWKPDTTYTRFVHEHTITASEKNAILNWIATGAPKGDTTQAPAPPVYTRYQINATPDLELTIPTFISNADTSDSYVCFSLPTNLTQDNIIRAFEVVPGNAPIVHHIVVYIDSTGTTTSDLSGNCFTSLSGVIIGGAASGSSPCIFPNSSILKAGINLKAGSHIILQIHYPAGTAGQADSTKIRLYFYPVGTANIRQMRASILLINDSLNIPADSVKVFTATRLVPLQMSIFSIFPHSHFIATKVLDYAYGSNDTIPLLKINNWDFDFQQFYTYRYMLKIPVGYNLFAQHTFDNTSNNPNNPSNPPVNVVSGITSLNEMLHDGFQWLQYEEGDELINIDSLLTTDPLNSIKQNGTSNLQAYAFPNPFEKTVSIVYELDNPLKVSIEIYSVLGANVRTLKNSFESSGLHTVLWDGKNNEGANLADGTYFYIIKAGDNQSYGKLSLLSEKK